MLSAAARHRSTLLGLRGGVAAATVLTMVTGVLIATASPARAAENGVTDLLHVLGSDGDPTHNLAAWTSGLGGVDKLGEQLLLVTASPGGLLGFTDLFQKATSSLATTATTWCGAARAATRSSTPPPRTA